MTGMLSRETGRRRGMPFVSPMALTKAEAAVNSDAFGDLHLEPCNGMKSWAHSHESRVAPMLPRPKGARC